MYRGAHGNKTDGYTVTAELLGDCGGNFYRIRNVSKMVNPVSSPVHGSPGCSIRLKCPLSAIRLELKVYLKNSTAQETKTG